MIDYKASNIFDIIWFIFAVITHFQNHIIDLCRNHNSFNVRLLHFVDITCFWQHINEFRRYHMHCRTMTYVLLGEMSTMHLLLFYFHYVKNIYVFHVPASTVASLLYVSMQSFFNKKKVYLSKMLVIERNASQSFNVFRSVVNLI